MLNSFKLSKICCCMGDHTVDAHFGCGGTKVVYVVDLRSLLWTLMFLSSNLSIFTDLSKAVLLLWIIYVISVLFCYAFMHVCLLMPCGNLLGKG